MIEINDVLIPVIIVGGLGLVFGILLAIAGKLFATKGNSLAEAIRAELPGANCGSCGFSNCDKYAEAVASGEAKCNLCRVGGRAAMEKLCEIKGEAAEEETQTEHAFVFCSGGKNCKEKYDYIGLNDCRAAASIGNGPMSCEFGCIGLGNCVRACPQQAISLVDGVARVNPEKCTGCSICVNTCPKGIIHLVPAQANVFIPCSSTQIGGIVRKNCDIGCIGCRLCEKECPTQAIHVSDNLAKLSYSECIACGKCAEKCPRHVIIVNDSGISVKM